MFTKHMKMLDSSPLYEFTIIMQLFLYYWILKLASSPFFFSHFKSRCNEHMNIFWHKALSKFR